MTSAVSDKIFNPWHAETGLSSESEFVFETSCDAQDHTSQPISLGWKLDLYDQVIEIAADCSEPDWDGYDARPLSPEAKERALQIIRLLPDSVQIPELAPSPEGEISFEWYVGRDRLLSVTPQNELLIYAAIVGPDHTQYGRVPVRETWPEEILTILSRYFHDVR